jgi:hypothetical protein
MHNHYSECLGNLAADHRWQMLCDKMGTQNCKLYYRDVTLSTQHEPKQMPVTLNFTNKLTSFPLGFFNTAKQFINILLFFVSIQLFVCMLDIIIIKYSKMPLLSTEMSAVGVLRHTQMEYITFKATFTTFTETHG